MSLPRFRLFQIEFFGLVFIFFKVVFVFANSWICGLCGRDQVLIPATLCQESSADSGTVFPKIHGWFSVKTIYSLRGAQLMRQIHPLFGCFFREVKRRTSIKTYK